MVDLAGIVRQLEAVAARHPETAPELKPVIAALGDAGDAAIDAGQAAQLLGWPSAATVEAWIAHGGLPAERDARGCWRIPLAAALAVRERQAALLAVGGDDLTDDELVALAAGRFRPLALAIGVGQPVSAAGPAPTAPPRAVLDSSALVPAWSRLLLSEVATWRPAPFIPIWCEWIVAETWRVLTVRWLRERPLTTPADERRLSVAAGAMLRALLPVMEHVSVAPPFAPAWAGLADVDDLPVWTAAVRADAGYVVSQNVRDFPPRDADGLCRHGGVEFITPANFARDVLGLDPAAVAPRPIPADADHHARRP